MVNRELQEAIREILRYNWVPTNALRLSAQQWTQAETLLRTMLKHHLGYTLHSIEFLETMI